MIFIALVQSCRHLPKLFVPASFSPVVPGFPSSPLAGGLRHHRFEEFDDPDRWGPRFHDKRQREWRGFVVGISAN
jgi:hypothetical protein